MNFPGVGILFICVIYWYSIIAAPMLNTNTRTSRHFSPVVFLLYSQRSVRYLGNKLNVERLLLKGVSPNIT